MQESLIKYCVSKANLAVSAETNANIAGTNFRNSTDSSANSILASSLMKPFLKLSRIFGVREQTDSNIINYIFVFSLRGTLNNSRNWRRCKFEPQVLEYEDALIV